MWDAMLVGLAADRCAEREEPVWGPDEAFVVFPGRRREAVGVYPSLESSDGCDDLRCLMRGDDDELILLHSGCCGSWMGVASGRPLVSLGSDIAD